MSRNDKPDPILEALTKPSAPRIEPRLDEYQVPWCSKSCPYYVDIGASRFAPNDPGKRCELLGRTPESVCIPGVRILVNMANELACLQHEHEH